MNLKISNLNKMLTLSNNNLFGYNEFSGSSDLYPLLNKNLHNSWEKNNAVLLIQRVWRKYKQNKIKNVKERFASWFPF
jgi:hypothetical protein